MVELERAAEVRGGATPRRDRSEYWGGEIPWVTPTDLPDLGSGVVEVTTTTNTITAEGLDACSASLLPAGTVLFSSRATIGKVAVAAVPLATNQGFANLIPRPGVDPRYLAWCLLFHSERIGRLAGSTTFKEVAKGALKQFRIPLPALSEQRRIVEILDQADRLRRLRAEADAKADRILPALFIKMFGDPATNPHKWPRGRLGEAIADTQYGTSVRASSELGVAVIRMNNISPVGILDLSNLKFVRLEGREKERLRLRPGDLLFNRTNSVDLVGKTGLWSGEMEAVPASYLIRVRLRDDRACPEYIWAWMNTPFMKATLQAKARRAVGMANINATELRNLPAVFPPLERQRRFARYLQNLGESASARLDLQRKVEQLFSVLLRLAFRGELTAKWREGHMNELRQEMEQQVKFLETRSAAGIDAD